MKGQDQTETCNLSIMERRDFTIKALKEFGYTEFLIDSDEPYPVYFSEGVYTGFCEKYSEMKQLKKN